MSHCLSPRSPASWILGFHEASVDAWRHLSHQGPDHGLTMEGSSARATLLIICATIFPYDVRYLHRRRASRAWRSTRQAPPVLRMRAQSGFASVRVGADADLIERPRAAAAQRARDDRIVVVDHAAEALHHPRVGASALSRENPAQLHAPGPRVAETMRCSSAAMYGVGSSLSTPSFRRSRCRARATDPSLSTSRRPAAGDRDDVVARSCACRRRR